MIRFLKYILFFILLTSGPVNSMAAEAQQRFPKPEFSTGYSQPNTTVPHARFQLLEYLDVTILLLVLLVTTWMVLKKRSRIGVFWISVFCLLYFGWYREGCICAVGSVQNIVLGIVDPTYAIPLTALAFFLLPLIFALFAGRIFCAGACPLGAIQDIIVFKPIELPKWIQKVLGLIPVSYTHLRAHETDSYL